MRTNVRSGFTLLELLGVMVLISILLALLLPAVSSVRRTVQDSVTKAEIVNFNSALTTFRNTFGCYPPSSITIYNTPAGWKGDPLSLSKMVRMFPNFDPNVATYPWDPISPQPCNGPKPGRRTSHASMYPMVLNGAECLVFFLGGPLYGTQYDSAGNIVKWGQPIGFSHNPADPLGLNIKENRIGPFIALDSRRFTDVDDDGIPELSDSLPTQSLPIVYVESGDGGGYNSAEAVVSNNAMILDPTFDLSSVYTNAGVPVNLKTFQLISPGRDEAYGVGGDVSNLGDNITNFQ